MQQILVKLCQWVGICIIKIKKLIFIKYQKEISMQYEYKNGQIVKVNKKRFKEASKIVMPKLKDINNIKKGIINMVKKQSEQLFNNKVLKSFTAKDKVYTLEKRADNLFVVRDGYRTLKISTTLEPAE